ncbi:hypothetical protein [Deinococcus cellulosilyticus]|nr:hypothetical protein [Deinococcus cellulosilyticus]
MELSGAKVNPADSGRSFQEEETMAVLAIHQHSDSGFLDRVQGSVHVVRDTFFILPERLVQDSPAQVKA